MIASHPARGTQGTNAAIDSYSAFYDNQKLNQTALLAQLRARDVTHLFVTGLALDVCVAFSALHAAEEGFVVTVSSHARRTHGARTSAQRVLEHGPQLARECGPQRGPQRTLRCRFGTRRER